MQDLLENKKLREFPFEVPESYFSFLEESVRERIKEKPQKSSLWRFLKPSLALAAAFVAIMAIGGVVLRYTTGMYDDEISIIAQNEEGNFMDTLRDRYISQQIENAYIENENIEEVYNELTSGTNSPEQQANLEEEVMEYISAAPTSISNLLAEEIYNR